MPILGRDQAMMATYPNSSNTQGATQRQPSSGLASPFWQHGVTLSNTKCVRQQDPDAAVRQIWQNTQKHTATAVIKHLQADLKSKAWPLEVFISTAGASPKPPHPDHQNTNAATDHEYKDLSLALLRSHQSQGTWKQNQ